MLIAKVSASYVAEVENIGSDVLLGWSGLKH